MDKTATIIFGAVNATAAIVMAFATLRSMFIEKEDKDDDNGDSFDGEQKVSGAGRDRRRARSGHFVRPRLVGRSDERVGGASVESGEAVCDDGGNPVSGVPGQ